MSPFCRKYRFPCPYLCPCLYPYSYCITCEYVVLVSENFAAINAVHRDNRGVIWVDDSKATNVEASYTGLVGLKGQKSVILLGGLAKVVILYLLSSVMTSACLLRSTIV